jgi:hypothetical protein
MADIPITDELSEALDLNRAQPEGLNHRLLESDVVSNPNRYSAGNSSLSVGNGQGGQRVTLRSLSRWAGTRAMTQEMTGRADWAPLNQESYVAIVSLPVRIMSLRELLAECHTNNWNAPLRALEIANHNPEKLDMLVPIVYAYSLRHWPMEPPPRRLSCAAFLDPRDPMVWEQKAFIGLNPGAEVDGPNVQLPPPRAAIRVHFDEHIGSVGFNDIGYYSAILSEPPEISSDRTAEIESGYGTCPSLAEQMESSSESSTVGETEAASAAETEGCTEEQQARADRGNTIAKASCEGGWGYGEGVRGLLGGQRNAVLRGGVVEFAVNFWTGGEDTQAARRAVRELDRGNRTAAREAAKPSEVIDL